MLQILSRLYDSKTLMCKYMFKELKDTTVHKYHLTAIAKAPCNNMLALMKLAISNLATNRWQLERLFFI